jgi:hypothetical protein
MREEGLTGDALVAAAIAEFAVSFQAAVIELKYLHLITKAEHDELMTRRDAEDFRVGDFVDQFGLTLRPDTGPPEELDPSYLAMVKSRYEHGGLNVTAVATALRIDEPAAQEWLEGQGVKAPEPIEDDGFYLPE